MKHFKRLFCLLLALVVALSLCACGDSSKRDRDDDDEDDHSLADLIGPLGEDKKVETPVTNATPVTTAPREPVLKRGNEVGDVCYDADLAVINVENIQEETVDPTSFGKVTVINFWGTWVGPSRAEMSYLDEIAKKYGNQIAVVAVHGILSETAPAFITEYYPDSPIVFATDTGDNEDEYYTKMGGSDAYPSTFVLNEKGVITHIFRQAVTQTELETAVLEAMGRM